MRKTEFIRWCNQCGKLHKTRHRRATKCEFCKKKNFEELKMKRILRMPNYCSARKDVSIIAE